MGGVDVGVDVRLESGVQRHHPESADDAGVVGDFLGAQHDARGEEVDIVHELLELAAGDGQTGGTGADQLAVGQQVHHGILQDLGVHREGRNVGVFAERRQNGVGDVADAGLQRQQLGGNPAGAPLRQQEGHHVAGDLVADRVRRCKRPDLVRLVALHDTHHLAGIHGGVRAADAGEGVEDRDGVAVRRRRQDEDIAHLPQARRLVPVDFDDDLVGVSQIGGGGPDGGGQVDAPVRRDFGGLDDGQIDPPEKPLGHGLGQVGEVHVHIFHLLTIDLAPQGLAGLIGGGPGHDPGTFLAAPAGVNPLKATVSASLTWVMASAALSRAKGP